MVETVISSDHSALRHRLSRATTYRRYKLVLESEEPKFRRDDFDCDFDDALDSAYPEGDLSPRKPDNLSCSSEIEPITTVPRATE